MNGRVDGHRGPKEADGSESVDPLAAMLPLLQALPLPAVLYQLDGTVVGGSTAFEVLYGADPAGMPGQELLARLEVRSPTGREIGLDDLRRSFEAEPHPAVSVDLRDGAGRYRAMIASAGAARSGEKTVGLVVVLTDITALVEANRAARN